jgi:hypothetical protein
MYLKLGLRQRKGCLVVGGRRSEVAEAAHHVPRGVSDQPDHGAVTGVVDAPILDLGNHYTHAAAWTLRFTLHTTTHQRKLAQPISSSCLSAAFRRIQRGCTRHPPTT